ncbi:MAG: hypothetical protein R2787_04590 [Saprospiraceae bacterium]
MKISLLADPMIGVVGGVAVCENTRLQCLNPSTRTFQPGKPPGNISKKNFRTDYDTAYSKSIGETNGVPSC